MRILWTWRVRPGEQEIKSKQLRGEIGILREVFLSQVDPKSRIFLIVEHETREYMGCLIFSDQTFCGEIYDLLKGCVGQSIAAIGSLEVGHVP